ncbi:MAG: efflux RND transporter permease subunit, partial [Deltaproteobacteria bacterium]|nr:efflux RND transporter permease subunit [Deltaproteobacteria bacterium]
PFRTPETLGLLVLKNTDSGTVLLRDVAEVRLGHKTGGSFNISDQGPALTVNVYREAGSNLLQVTEKAQAVIEQLNSGLLKDEKLTLRVISDPSYYIHSAIDLVLENIYLGGFLAIFSLYLFLGSLRSALVIALSIPTSIITTFVFLRLTGRNINVISLAGLAFAVGMVVDASIVVLENIDTWRKKGHSRFDSLLKATKEVHNAILASSLTTVAVFLPVALVKDQAGQLFRDIALAIVFAILISYLVSTTVVPSLYRVLMDRVPDVKMQSDWLHRQVSQLHRLGRRFSDGLVAQVHWLQQTLQRKLVVVVGGTAVALLCSWALMPKMEYLPGGNQNLLLSLLFPPTGYNENELTAVGRQVVAALKPYSEGEKDGFPRIKRVFFVSFSTNALVGTVSEDPRRVAELIPLVNRVIGNVAGIRGFTNQTSLFERGMGAGRSIDLEIYGTDLFETAGVAQDLYSRVNQVLPGSQVRAVPAFELDNPELRIEPDPVRTSAAGLSTADLGLIVDIYTDGRKIDEFSLPGGRTLDVNLIPAEGGIRRLEDFESRLLLTPDNRRITIGSVARVRESVGPNQIDHLSGQRAYVLRVLPPSAMPLETALNLLDKTLLTQARNDYAHVPGLHFALTGTADAFTKTRQALDDGLILALAITFLLLVILFEDLLSPLVIMGALPIAGMGGLLALKLVNLFLADQPLDMLTLLGFMMMIGIVVNNPILIVSRALDLIREESWPLSEAIVEGVRSRLRPIFMTTTTSVFGLLPLVVKPGAGSELYRGLGAAVLGGLVLSTLVNLVFVPCLFSLFQDLQRALLPRTVEEAAHQTTEQPSFIQGD